MRESRELSSLPTSPTIPTHSITLKRCLCAGGCVCVAVVNGEISYRMFMKDHRQVYHVIFLSPLLVSSETGVAYFSACLQQPYKYLLIHFFLSNQTFLSGSLSLELSLSLCLVLPLLDNILHCCF